MTRTPKLLGKQLGLDARVPLICMPHHDNHAWFSFAASPFADTGEPVARDAIVFSLPDAAGARWSTTSSRVVAVQTGAGGEARAYLVTTEAAEGPWQVVARAESGDDA